MFEKGNIMETIRNVDVNRLHDFKNHPFKVEMNTELCELMRSIEKEGVLVPLLVRTNPYGDGYEVISGHRRKAAKEEARQEANKEVMTMVGSQL